VNRALPLKGGGDAYGVLRLRGPLASRNFRVLAACNVISLTGSALSFVALPFAVLEAGGSAAVLTAGGALIVALPLLLLLLPEIRRLGVPARNEPLTMPQS